MRPGWDDHELHILTPRFLDHCRWGCLRPARRRFHPAGCRPVRDPDTAAKPCPRPRQHRSQSAQCRRRPVEPERDLGAEHEPRVVNPQPTRAPFATVQLGPPGHNFARSPIARAKSDWDRRLQPKTCRLGFRGVSRCRASEFAKPVGARYTETVVNALSRCCSGHKRSGALRHGIHGSFQSATNAEGHPRKHGLRPIACRRVESLIARRQHGQGRFPSVGEFAAETALMRQPFHPSLQ